MIRELATPKCRFYANRIPSLLVNPANIKKLNYSDVINELQKDLVFRQEYPGDHINSWDFDRLNKIGQQVGFAHIIRSKPNGSVSLAMQGPDIDKTHPQMSLYVEMIK